MTGIGRREGGCQSQSQVVDGMLAAVRVHSALCALCTGTGTGTRAGCSPLASLSLSPLVRLVLLLLDLDL